MTEEELAQLIRRHLVAFIQLFNRDWLREFDIAVTVRRKT